VLLSYALRRLERLYDRARRNEQALDAANQALEESRDTLERQTQELARRARSLEASTEVSREIAATLSVEDLLPRVIATISEQFGIYRMGIFLLDESGEWAVLRATSKEVEERMLGRGFRLAVQGKGTVAHVISTGKAHVAADVTRDPFFLHVAELADTRSEVTLPLRARGETLGAMSIQSVELDVFDQEDVAVLQTMADQVAMAISNARLFQQVQESLESERRAYGEWSRARWSDFLRNRQGLQALRGSHDPAGEAIAWWEEDEATRGPAEQQEDRSSQLQEDDMQQASGLRIPIEIHGRKVGTIDAYKGGGVAGWTDEQRALLRTLSDQLALALDSARLYEDTQRRAARERTLSEVTGRIRESMEVDGVLKRAAQEMREALGVAEVEVRLLASAAALPPEGER
jgi:GAF domain-containing protein